MLNQLFLRAAPLRLLGSRTTERLLAAQAPPGAASTKVGQRRGLGHRPEGFSEILS